MTGALIVAAVLFALGAWWFMVPQPTGRRADPLAGLLAAIFVVCAGLSAVAVVIRWIANA